MGFNPCQKGPLEEKWLPTPVLFSGKSHGGLVAIGCESDRTELLNTLESQKSGNFYTSVI